jgi:cysteine desulfurase
MMMDRIYLDYASTTPVDPRVVAAMVPYFQCTFGNPSALHGCGQEARSAVEEARCTVAAAIGALPEEIIFTSGGTESDNTAIKGVVLASRNKGNHIITTAVEHHAVIESCHTLENMGFEVTFLPVDGYGMVDPDGVRKSIRPQTVLISVMHANNEVGTVQPITEIGAIAREAGVPFHTDAVQTVGHIPVNVYALNIDLLSCSAHKLYGPKGVGFLYARKGTRLAPFVEGGSQESGRRAGTENVPGIVGLAAALQLASENLAAESTLEVALRSWLVSGILDEIPGSRLNGHPVKRLPGNASISIEGAEGESLLISLDREGVCVSTGSACSAGSGKPSHVLAAMAVPLTLAQCSLRFSLGRWTTAGEIGTVLEILPRIAARLRAMSPLRVSSLQEAA